jgi:tetratricopeptide (TPR) repeat protein
MSQTPRWALIGLVLVLPGPLPAQAPSDREKVVPLELKKPISRADLDRREAQRLYAQGMLDERKNRLVEAVRAYEAAARLDPDAAAIPRALAPLYLALDRSDDAIAACKRTLLLDRDDYQTGYLLGRQLRGLDRDKEAFAVLKKTVKSKKLAERPDQAAQVWYDLGLLQEKAGNLAEAEKCLRQVVAHLDNAGGMVESGRLTREEVVSQTAETWERLGQICLKAKAIDRAVHAFEQAQKKDELRAPRLAYNLAQVLRDQGKYREALAQLEIYLQSQPQSVEGYELKINLQRKLRQHARIVPELEASSGRDRNNLALRLLLAREYRKAGRSTEAETVYTDLLKRSLNPDVYRGLFELYKSQGRVGAERILMKLDAALEGAAGDGDKKQGNPADAANARAMLSVLRDETELVKQILEVSIRWLGTRKLGYPTRAILATLAGRTKQLDMAEKLYRACLDRPGGLGTMETEVFTGLLEVLQLRYNHAAIIEISKLGLAKAQQTNRVLFHRALVYAYLHLNRFKEALAAADDAVNDAAKPQILGSRKLRVYALSEAGKHKEAQAQCQAMLKEYNQGSELREVRLTLSRVLLQMGKHEESDKQLELILEADANDATACNDLGYHWADRNEKLDEAERLIRKAIDLDRKQRQNSFPSPDTDQDNAAFVDSLGWVFFRQGKLAEARAELEKASKLPTGDDDPVVFDHLGDVYFRMGEKAKALSAWKQALSLYELGSRRKSDERHKEIQEKVRLLRQ